VAEVTGGLVQIHETGGVEPGSVGVYTHSCLGRVTTHAVGLLMAGHTALQILPGSEGMAEKTQTLIVMESGEEGAALIKAKVQVAFPTKSLGVVAGTTVADPAVGFGPVGSQEVDGVELRRPQPVMALNAGVLRMAAVTIRLACRRRGPMRQFEDLAVERW